jgi:hypothetical protein
MAGTASRSGGDRSLRGDPTRPDGLPEAPNGRTEAFYSQWAFLLAHLPERCLRRIDAAQLAILAEHLVEFDELTQLIAKDPSDLKIRSLRMRIGAQISRLSAQFGLSPMDRQRLSVDLSEETEDPFETLLDRISGRDDAD